MKPRMSVSYEAIIAALTTRLGELEYENCVLKAALKNCEETATPPAEQPDTSSPATASPSPTSRSVPTGA